MTRKRIDAKQRLIEAIFLDIVFLDFKQETLQN